MNNFSCIFHIRRKIILSEYFFLYISYTAKNKKWIISIIWSEGKSIFSNKDCEFKKCFHFLQVLPRSYKIKEWNLLEKFYKNRDPVSWDPLICSHHPTSRPRHFQKERGSNSPPCWLSLIPLFSFGVSLTRQFNMTSSGFLNLNVGDFILTLSDFYLEDHRVDIQSLLRRETHCNKKTLRNHYQSDVRFEVFWHFFVHGLQRFNESSFGSLKLCILPLQPTIYHCHKFKCPW